MKATNPSGQTVHFDTEKFIFRIEETGQRLSSVSKVLRTFFPEFNAREVAQKCINKTEYSGMTADEIVSLWESEGDLSRTEGDNVHAMINCHIKNEPIPKPLSMRCVRMFKCALKSLHKLKSHYQIIGSEVMVFSASLGIAGFIDLLLRRNEEIIPIDWKTNKQIKTENKWEKALPPIQHIQHCNLSEYKLQLSLLKKILDHENYFPNAKYKLGIIHLQEIDEAVGMKIEPMDSEVEGMIEKFSELYT